jgi:hypothetical protein
MVAWASLQKSTGTNFSTPPDLVEKTPASERGYHKDTKVKNGGINPACGKQAAAAFGEESSGEREEQAGAVEAVF